MQLKTDGSLEREDAAAARDEIARLADYTDRPITWARLTLRQTRARRPQRPVVADAVVSVDGRPLRAHRTGRSAREAAAAAFDHLRRQLQRIVGADVALRNEPRVIQQALADLEPRLPADDRPDADLKPPSEREIVHRHAYVDTPLSTLEAVADLLDMDVEFHLFRHVRTEEDVVVHRRDDGGIGLLVPQGSELLDENDIVVPEESRYDRQLTLAEAREEMDLVNHRYLYFTDAKDGRGKVLYLRHDGDYGLVQPRDHA